ncbi:hypothetical protein GCM10007301_19670 [Azorhizobium oxalatiphilum]|uniref:Uncharacterized protein n=1 Tax=Azorhizobium oxalatiphilum TaxID=980631 RepID=A0A917BX51_9HYPH|nr:hypothetical protein GCM10007301_19670 [Azorhizobium oxalatiphilum]
MTPFGEKSDSSTLSPTLHALGRAFANEAGGKRKCGLRRKRLARCTTGVSEEAENAFFSIEAHLAIASMPEQALRFAGRPAAPSFRRPADTKINHVQPCPSGHAYIQLTTSGRGH